MKKLLLVFGVLMGMLTLGSQSYAVTGGNSSLKTAVQVPLVGSVSNLPTAFVTGTTNANTVNFCSTSTTGSGATSGILLNCGGAPITGISMSGGASGGTIAIYDANTNQVNQAFPAEVGSAECVFEATVAANTQNYYDLHDAPINTQNGVVAIATSTSGVVVYSSPGVAANH